MKIYHIERTDECGYDEYDSFIVRAENEEEVLKLLVNYYGFDKTNTEIKEIKNDGESKIILESFNAG